MRERWSEYWDSLDMTEYGDGECEEEAYCPVIYMFFLAHGLIGLVLVPIKPVR